MQEEENVNNRFKILSQKKKPTMEAISTLSLRYTHRLSNQRRVKRRAKMRTTLTKTVSRLMDSNRLILTRLDSRKIWK